MYHSEIMTAERANKVYDLLVNIGKASENDRENFIYHHTENGCGEWRFGGALGFGGKYLSRYNKVTCYEEEENPKRIKLMEKLNTTLATV